MKQVIFVLLFLSLTSQAWADEEVILKNGRKAILKDNGTWSYEYEHAIALPKKQPETHETISLDELIMNIGSMEGVKVKTQGLAQVYEFMLTLKQNAEDEDALAVNINGLSKEERNKLQTECKNGCNVTVYGRVGELIRDEIGVIAERVAW